MKVNLIYNRIPHHDSHSGYDQIAHHLASRIPVKTLDDYMTKIISDSAWGHIASRSSPWMARCADMDWYDTYSLSLEAAAFLKVLWGSGELYHILYGENTYRYLGWLRRIARWKGTRLVCSYHQPPRTFKQVVRCKSILKGLDGIIVVASNQASYFASFVGAEQVFVVPLGIDTDYFVPSPNEKGDRPICLFVGQWLRDFAMLGAVIQAMECQAPDVLFKIITRPDIAASYCDRQNVIALSGLSDAELLNAYQTADLLLMPLTDCTANCAVLEGMACGLPIVATDVGGIRDYVDATMARLVAPSDVKGMCAAIQQLTSDRRLLRALALESRTRALEFAWPCVVDRLVAVYTAVMES